MATHSSILAWRIPWTIAHQAPLFMGFSRQEYWSGLPFPSPGDLLNPGIKPGSPTVQADFLPSVSPGKPRKDISYFQIRSLEKKETRKTQSIL